MESRLLDEGMFVASYKFALLLALADLSIEEGNDSRSPLTLTTDAIAEKFIQYYWRQVVPYPSAGQKRRFETKYGPTGRSRHSPWGRTRNSW
jgi:hypothetical protein